MGKALWSASDEWHFPGMHLLLGLTAWCIWWLWICFDASFKLDPGADATYDTSMHGMHPIIFTFKQIHAFFCTQKSPSSPTETKDFAVPLWLNSNYNYRSTHSGF